MGAFSEIGNKLEEVTHRIKEVDAGDLELPDDSGDLDFDLELPDDSGDLDFDLELPDDSGEMLNYNKEGDSVDPFQKEIEYSRPSHWRSGMRDEVWDNAKDEHGRVRDPVTGQFMSKDQPWDMGHKPGFEFYKHQESAMEREISRDQFLDEYYDVSHYRPELPSSNRSHKGEDVTNVYYGD